MLGSGDLPSSVRRRAAKATLTAAAIVGLLVLVALGARGGHPGAGGRIAQRAVPARVSDDLLTLLIVLYVLGIIGVAAAIWAVREKWKPVDSHWIRNVLLSLVLFSLIGFLGAEIAALRNRHHGSHTQPAAQQPGGGRARIRQPPTIPRGAPRAHFDWPLAVGLVGLLVVGGVLYAVRTKTPGKDLLAPTRDDVVEELSAVFTDTIEDLRAEPDARRAVIAAYARMEAVLARHGQARRPAEAPFEYLSRILLGLRVGAAAVRKLTELFEVAKFSVHPIDTDMKERAISAFVSVRDDLRRPAVA